MDIFKPVRTYGTNGQYSTVVLANGQIETMFFPADNSEAILIGRTAPIKAIHDKHVTEHRYSN